MFVAAISVFGKDNRPLVIRTKFHYDSLGNDVKTRSEEQQGEEQKLHTLLQSSLEFMEDGMKTVSSSSEEDDQSHHHVTGRARMATRDPFIGILTQMEGYRVYGLISTTKTKVIVIISVAQDQVVRYFSNYILFQRLINDKHFGNNIIFFFSFSCLTTSQTETLMSNIWSNKFILHTLKQRHSILFILLETKLCQKDLNRELSPCLLKLDS